MADNCKAVILAGGMGKRFWPLTVHKSMVSFLGKSILMYNLEMLKKIGIVDVIIVVPSYESSITGIEKHGMNITFIVQPVARGMWDAVLQAKDAIGTGPCLFLNASDIVDVSLFEQMKKEMEKDSIIITGKTMESYFDGGYLQLDGDRVTGIIEKPGEGKEPSNLVNLVFHFFPDPSAFLEVLKRVESAADDVYEKALTQVLQKTPSNVIRYEGYWQPVKYPWHILDAMDYFLTQSCTSYRGKNVEIKSNVIIEGPVHIEDNVRIFENTKIVGPCYIGRDTIIGNNNIIRHSHIGVGCVTGFNTDITRSYIGDACWFHSNYIGDSVLEENVSLGSGTVFANLRLDEGDIWSFVKDQRINTRRSKLGAIIGPDVRIGVNTSVMPGIKIGKHSFIGAGMIVDKDIPDDSFCMAESKYSIKKNMHAQLPRRDEFKKRI